MECVCVCVCANVAAPRGRDWLSLRPVCVRMCVCHVWHRCVGAVEGLAYVITRIQGLFFRISSLLQGSFAKETYNLIDPTDRSHPIGLGYVITHVKREGEGEGKREYVCVCVFVCAEVGDASGYFAEYRPFCRALLQKRPKFNRSY